MTERRLNVVLTVYDEEAIRRRDPRSKPGWWVSLHDLATYSAYRYIPRSEGDERDAVAAELGHVILDYAENLIPEDDE